MSPPESGVTNLRLPGVPLRAPTSVYLGDARTAANYWLTHAVAPAFALSVLSFLLMEMRGDLFVADAIYALQGNEWWFKKTFLAEKVIHIAGRDLSILVWLAIFGGWVASFRNERLAAWRRPLAYLALTTLACVTVVSMLKATTNMDCPWDLARYGGSREYLGLFDIRPYGMPRGGCFPAGHAGTGYSWIALYFFFGLTRPRYRNLGLAIGLVAGLVFGISQQFRGAHFLSHDVWSLALCWYLALGIHLAMFRRGGSPAMAMPEAANG